MRASVPVLLAAATTLAAGTPMRVPVPPAAATTPAAAGAPRPGPLERVRANDNRSPAGTLRGGVLTLRLEARLADWHPQADDGPGAAIPAFAEAGRAPLIPGPLIRVPAGTTADVTLRNTLRDTLVVYGLHDRTGAPVASEARSGVRLLPGEVRTLRFRLELPGTYYYYGTTMGRTIIWRTREDAQLTGAIVVDPAGAPPPRDRILVIGVWSDTVGRAYVQERRLLAVINGRSWPYTERLTYQVGDTVHWRVINASADNHPMHLHGFYFRVDARGNGVADAESAPDTADREVTESMVPGTTLRLTFVAERPGHWLFHCHLPVHVAPRGPLGLAPAPMAHAGTHDALHDMGGLVLGIDVRPTAGYKAAPPGDDVRRLRLVVRRNTGGSDTTPYYGFSFGDDVAATLPDSGLHLGPPLVLTRGQPVGITVVNTVGEPTSVHWHGIELESYYDGVGGWSGSAGRVAPTIAPGDSFTARFTPPRAGTFIYHTHVDEERQEPAGLAGPIIVLEPGQAWDPATDHPVLITSPWSFEEGRTGLLLNGSHTPAPLVLRAGVPHRFRFINMTLRHPAVSVEIRRDSALASWRPLAHDGADLPADRRRPGPAFLRNVSVGQTYDFEFAPDQPGDYRLEVRLNGVNVSVHPLMATLPIRVVREEAAR